MQTFARRRVLSLSRLQGYWGPLLVACLDSHHRSALTIFLFSIVIILFYFIVSFLILTINNVRRRGLERRYECCGNRLRILRLEYLLGFI
jgi:hypothetical protein